MARDSNFSGQWIARQVDNRIEAEYGWGLSVFLLLFAAIFSMQRLGFGGGPAEGVEQWVNLTNQMFYGKQDFLFSYGPAYWITGAAATPYNAFAYWAAVLACSMVYASFWSLFFTLAFQSRAYIFFAAGYFLFFYSLIFPWAWYLWPLAAIAYLEFSRQEPIGIDVKGLFLLGLVTGLAFYIRYFYGLIAIVAFGGYFFSRSVVHRKYFSFVPYVLGAIFGYILAGLVIFHRWESLLDYIFINNQLNFGNSVDMTLESVARGNHLLAAMVAMAALCVYALIRRRILFLTMCALSLVFLKMGFSRIDHYIGYFVVPMAVLSSLLLFDGSKSGRALFILSLGCLWFIQSVPAFPGAPTRGAFQLPEDLGGNYADRMERVYGAYKLDASLTNRVGLSSIDVYPYNNEYVFANKLNYLRRPLFQNYMTLTPSLDAMNARFFESGDRPRFVLWTAGVACRSEACNVFDAFDGKFSLNEDPLTSSSILLNYHMVAVSKGRGEIPVALMEENAAHTEYTARRIEQESMKFGQWYKVPRINDGVVKLVPQFKLSMVGRLKNLLFRGGIVRVSYKLVSGEVVSYRLNILNSASGVWGSPLPSSFDWLGSQVDSVLLETSTPEYFSPAFSGDWVLVPITAVHARKPAFDPVVSLPADVKDKVRVTCDGAIDVLNGIAPIPPRIHDADIVVAQGWLAYSARDGRPFDRILITLTDERGTTTFVATTPQERPDVAQAYHQVGLTSVGYKAVVDLSALKGTFTLGLAGAHGTELVTCSQFASIIEANGSAR